MHFAWRPFAEDALLVLGFLLARITSVMDRRAFRRLQVRHLSYHGALSVPFLSESLILLFDLLQLLALFFERQLDTFSLFFYPVAVLAVLDGQLPLSLAPLLLLVGKLDGAEVLAPRFLQEMYLFRVLLFKCILLSLE